MKLLIVKEVYRPVKGFEGLYEVSNFGNVRSLKKIIGRRVVDARLLKQRISTQGYLMVSLTRNYKTFNASVHRLIAEAFIDNPFNKATVNHIDGNKLNNDISNLEWATQRENNIHAYRTGLHDPKKNGRTGKRKPRTEEEKKLISIKTREAMQRKDVQDKLHRSRKRVES